MSFLRKMLNRQFDRWMDRQNSDFIGRSVGRGPIITVTLSFSEFISAY